MIDYDEDWLIKLIFRSEGSVGLRALIFAVPAGLLSVILLVVQDHVNEFFVESGIDAITGSQSWAAATGVLAVLLSFRTRQALSRFWEGTGLLHQMRGEWFDSVSCCVTFSRAAQATKPQEVLDFRHTLVRLMSLCHGSALEEIADDSGDINIPIIDLTGLDVMTLKHLKECKEVHDFNRVEVILHLIQTLITKNLDTGVLKIPPPILSRVYQTLSRGFVNLLNAKKITDTRFPFPYAQLLSILLLLHTVLTPIMIAELITHKVWAFVFTLVPIFGMFSLNFTASQLENPFGNDDNDLPLANFQEEMNGSLLMLLHQNSDHIASVSSICMMNFAELASSMKEVEAGAAPRIGLMPSLSSTLDSTRRTLQSSPRAEIAAAANRMAEEQAKAQADELKEEPPPAPVAPPPAEPAPAEPAAPAPEAPPPPQAEEPQRSKAQIQLMRGMDDFNKALQSWTKMVDGQIGDLSRSFADLRRISDRVPALLESLQDETKPWKKSLEDEDTIRSLQAFPAI